MHLRRLNKCVVPKRDVTYYPKVICLQMASMSTKFMKGYHLNQFVASTRNDLIK